MSNSKRSRRRGRAREVKGSSGRLWPVVIVVVLLFGTGGVFFMRNVLDRPSTAPGASGSAPASGAASSAEPGEAVPIQGNAHIKEGEAHPDYNSDPPTSGWHLDQPLQAGFYEEPQLDEALVHNLEHGHVVIAYDCTKLTSPSASSGGISGQSCDDVKAKLRAVVDSYNGWKVTVVPRQNRDAAIGLTAWGRIDKLDDYDEARITAFIDAYRDKGPEKTSQ